MRNDGSGNGRPPHSTATITHNNTRLRHAMHALPLSFARCHARLFRLGQVLLPPPWPATSFVAVQGFCSSVRYDVIVAWRHIRTWIPVTLSQKTIPDHTGNVWRNGRRARTHTSAIGQKVELSQFFGSLDSISTARARFFLVRPSSEKSS